MTTLAQDTAAATIASAEGNYLYAIIDGLEDQQPLGLTGLDGGEIFAIAEFGHSKDPSRASSTGSAPRCSQEADGRSYRSADGFRTDRRER